MTVNGKEYAVIRLLGKGKGGYSYLVERDGQRYVLKQIHHEPCDYYQFGDKLQSELRDYQKLQAVGIPLPELLETDMEQERLLKEYIEGDTVMDLVKQERLEEKWLHRMEQMCGPIYAAGLNIDYFPTNFIPRGEKLYYIDYECNPYDAKWDFENWGRAYWSKTPAFLQYVAEHGN